MIIPEDTLKAETLNRVIEEFVLREGTDYGLREFSLEQKVNTSNLQLSKKDVHCFRQCYGNGQHS